MGKIYHTYIWLLLLLGTIFLPTYSFAQVDCDPNVPSFVIDLTGNPDSVWVSPEVARKGQCCKPTNNKTDRCLEFILTLDPGAQGIVFDIESGAIPPGALFYDVNCTLRQNFGDLLCLDAAGSPYTITFCKPGGNQNAFSITSIPAPDVTDPIVVTEACFGQLSVTGLEPGTITWTSVPDDATHNGYMDCRTCDTVNVKGDVNAPPYVEYKVEGIIAGGCSTDSVELFTRAYFFDNAAVEILPKDPYVCFGTVGATLTATTSGGPKPHTYLWSTGSTDSMIVATPGTYWVRTIDALGCSEAYDTVEVHAQPNYATADAGPDFTSCSISPTGNLSGIVTHSSGGIWTGGAGTYSPRPDSLQVSYTPTAGEISSGSVTHTLTTTNDYGCPPVSDEVVQYFEEPPTLSAGPDQTVCSNLSLIPLNGTTTGNGAQWTTSGTGTFFPNDSTLTAEYRPSADDITNGSVTLTLTNSGDICPGITDDVILTLIPAPVIDAGVDGTICFNNPDIALSGTAENVDSYTWTGNGGTFSPNATGSLTPTYTPSATELNAGTVTLTLSGGNTNCPTISDQVSFTVTPAPTVNAGPDLTVCTNANEAQLNGTVTVATGGTWSGGAGTFVPDANTLNARYIPSSAEMTAGSVTLTLTSTGNGTCLPVTDQITIQILDGPTIDAGPDVFVCENNPQASLSATITNASGVSWTGNGGSFAPNRVSANVDYILSPTEVNSGLSPIYVETTGSGICPPARDTIIVFVSPAPIIDAGPDQTLCADAPTFTLNGTGTNAENVLWSGGTGTFSDNTSLTSTYTPSPAEITAGTVTLTLTGSKASCLDVTDQITLTITPAPIVDAGSDQNVCKTTPNVPLSGTVTNATGGQWSGGAGSFANSSSLTTTYQPTGAELNAGSVTLTLTSTGNGLCQPVSDDIVITFLDGPTVDGGPDLFVCSNNPTISLSATFTNAGGIQWLGNGGSFNPSPISPTVDYTLSQAEIDAVINVLYVETTGNGICPPARDTIEFIVTPSPVANAGPDMTVCENIGGIQLNGSATSATTYNWTGGLGTFNNQTILNPVYTPSASELAFGSVTLTLEASRVTCFPDTDEITISFTPAPTVDAGPNQTVCANNSAVSISGTVTDATGGTWSGGSGSFGDANSLSTTYSPTATEIDAGSLYLYLTTTGSGTCTPVTDSVLVTITPAPVADAGTDITVCENNGNVQLNGAVTVASGGVWSGGDGTYLPNANTLNAIYVPTADELASGNFSLTLTTTGNGNCLAVTDQVTINVTPAPTVDAGPDLTSCKNNSAVTLNGSVTVATGGQWSGGTGTFSSTTDLGATYTPSSNELIAGSVILTLTTTGNGSCIGVSDQVTITFTESPVVNAGPDITVCGTTTQVPLNGQVTNAGGGQWTTDGTGSFSPSANNLDANYVPSADDITRGFVTLTLTSTNNGNCLPETDQMGITFDLTPSANAGPDATVCSSDFPIQLNATGSLGSWSGGTGTYSPNMGTANAQYTPSADEITAGSVTLTYTTYANGTCPPISDQVTYTLLPSPIADAGSDLVICADQSSLQLTGTVTNATGGSWTTNGTGNILPNRNSLTIDYAITNSDRTAGQISFILHTTGGSCLPTTDTVFVTITPEVVVDAGSDLIACADVTSVPLYGTVSVATGGIWNTSGTGSFTPDANTLNASYVPSPQDTVNGSVVLSLTSTGNGSCQAVTEDITLTFTPAPTVDAGADQTICADESGVSLSGVVTVATGGSWTSSGDGMFSPNNVDLNATYIPSATDIANGNVTLTLTTTGNGTCQTYTDQMVITITPAPTVDAGTDQTVCANTTDIPLNGSVTIATGGAWTSSGTGNFTPSADDLNASYIPSAMDTVLGSITLTLTSTGNGTCQPVTDDMVIDFLPLIQLEAGPDFSVCADSAGFALSAELYHSNSITWGTTGTGSFDDNSITTPIYTPSATDTANGSVTLFASASNASSCPDAIDSVTVTILPAPVVEAGPDQTACKDVASISLDGLVSNAGGGIWTTSGTGTFNPSADVLATEYIPSSVDTANGGVILTLTSSANGMCRSVSDQLTVTLTEVVRVDAGPNQDLCGNTTGVSLDGTVITAGGGIWSSNGSGSFLPNDSTLNATYVPSMSDTLVGDVTLTLTTTGNGGCLPKTSTMDITFQSEPVLNVGPDLNLCASDNAINLNPSFRNADGLSWSTTGQGSFVPSATEPFPSYTFASADTSAGSISIFATTTGTGLCPAIGDTLNITFTPAPTVFAGDDQTLCADVATIPLNTATATGGTDMVWTTSGTGSFAPNERTVNATYIPSTLDADIGNVTLTLTNSGQGACSPISDVVTYVFQPVPMVDAGPDQSSCAETSSISLNGSVSNATGAVWSNPANGTFSPSDTVLNATFTPDSSQIALGFVVVTLTSTGNGVCAPATDQLQLTIIPTPTAEAGPNVNVCQSTDSIPLAGEVTTATGGTWTTNGSGTFFPNADDLNAVYLPSVNDQRSGGIVLTLTSTGNQGCQPATDTKNIFFSPLPVVDAGQASSCADGSGVPLNGAIGNATGAEWTTSGTGSFSPSTTDLSTFYTPSADDLTAGSVTLTLTTTGNNLCPHESDDLVLTLIPTPEADAGSNLTTCENSTITLNGSVTNATGGIWSASGGGAFTPSNTDLNATYQPSGIDIFNGYIDITLTTTGNGVGCPANSDVVRIVLTESPVSEAGDQIEVCSDATDVPVNGSVQNAGGGQWTTAGSGTFASPNSFSTTYSPSVADTSAGQVMLYFTTTGTGTCSPHTDSVLVVFQPLPTIDLGTDQQYCEDVGAIFFSADYNVATGVQWGTNGSGTITPDNFSMPMQYTPSDADRSNGAFLITATTTGNGLCPAVSDQISITLNPSPTVDILTNDNFCSDANSIPVQGSFTNADGIVWYSSGTGTYAPNDSSLTASYTLSAADKINGEVTLFLTTESSDGCFPATDSITVTLNPAPVAIAGPDQTVCGDQTTVNLSGNVSGTATGGTWSTLGNGTFTNANQLSTVYNLTPTDINNGQVTMILTTTGTGNCPPTTDTMLVNITPAATVTTTDGVFCSNEPSVPLDLAITNATGVNWTTAGDGTFSPSNTDLNAVYIPGPTDQANGSVDLSVDATGGCNAVSATFTLNLIAPPTTVANDISYCNNATNIPITGSTSTGSGMWTTTGNGSFTDENSLSTEYLPVASDTVNGYIELVLHSTNNGLCQSIRDTMRIDFTPAPTVDASAPVTCSDATSIAVEGTVTIATSINWSSTTGGSFSPNPDLNSNYTPTATDRTNGTATIIAETANNGTCLPVYDTLTLQIVPTPAADAGNDITVCSNESEVNLNGSVVGATGGVWTSTGTGVFSTNATNAVYIPSADDLTNGPITLTLQTTGTGVCPAATDAMELSFEPTATVDVGPDFTVCSDASDISISGVITVASSATWSTTGTGSFGSSTSSLNNTYIPTATDTANGSVSLILSTAPTSFCPSVVDTLVVELLPLPSITPLTSDICSDANGVPLEVSFSNATGVMWSTDGSGTFTPNEYLANATYVPSAADRTAGSVSLFVETTGMSPCEAAVDTIFLNIQPAPTVSAQSLLNTVCAGTGTVDLAATVENAGGVLWTSLGTGNFIDDQALNTTYNLSPADTSAGTVSFIAQTTGTGNCPSASDTVSVNIISLPTVIINAGQDLSICAEETEVSLNGELIGATEAEWMSSGNGVFSPDPYDLNATYYPDASDIAAGSIEIVLATSSLGPCPVEQDTMRITVLPAAIVDIGPDTVSLCGVTDQLDLSGTILGAPNGLWSTSGSGSFSPNAQSLNTSYLFSAQDVQDSTVILSLTSTGGNCKSSTTYKVVYLTPSPGPDAGPDLAYCEDVNDFSLFGRVEYATNSTWSTLGSGTFTDVNDLNTNYQPSATDASNGSVSLVLTSEGFGSCPDDMDTVTITFQGLPTVDAGPDLSICKDATLVPIEGSVTDASGVRWSNLGNGVFSPSPTDSITNYVPTTADTLSGYSTIILESTGNGACPPAYDTLEINYTPIPTVDAGPDLTFCEGETNIQLGATVTIATGVDWTSDGTGTFPDASILDAIYNPSTADGTSGRVVLTATSTGNGTCQPVTDFMLINFQAPPLVFAGNDLLVCPETDSIQLQGIVDGADGGTWVTNGGGTFFPSNNVLNAIYVPVPSDTSLASLDFELTSTGNGLCTGAVDSMAVSFKPQPVSNAIPALTACSDATSVTLSGTVTNATGGWWSGGAGFFQPNPSSLNATYILNDKDREAGFVTFTLTTTGSGLCQEAESYTTLTLEPAAISTAGIDKTVCADIDGVQLIGKVENATGGTWATSGTGTFNPDATTLDAQYIPSADDIQAGAVQLSLTTSGENATCLSKTDNLLLTITPAPTVDAGSVQTVCADVDQIDLSGSVTVATGGMWSSGGTGEFITPTNALDVSYRPSVNDTVNGSVMLYFTSTGNGTCNPVVDSVEVTITPAPKVFAGDGTLCADTSGVELNADQWHATGVQWTSAGTGSFAPNAFTNQITYKPSTPEINAGTGTLTATTTGNGTCKPVSTDITLIITPLPIANAGDDKIFCQGNDGVLTAYTQDDVSYAWYQPDGTLLNEGPTLTVTANNTADYVVSATDLKGCSTYDTVQVVPLVPPTMNLPAYYCDAPNLTLEVSPTNSPGVGEYFWYYNTNFLPEYAGPSAPSSGIGDYLVMFSYGDCQVMDSTLVLPLPDILGKDRLVCENDMITLEVSLTANATYEWFLNNASVGTGSSIQVQANNQVDNYVAEVTDAFGCQNYDTLIVEGRPLPLFDLNDTVACVNDAVVWDATPSNLGLDPLMTFLWTPSEVTTPTNNPILSPTESGDYILSYTLGECEAGDTVNVLFNPRPVTDMIDEETICLEEDTATVNLDAGPGHHYLWLYDQSTEQVITVADTGYFHVLVFNEFNCPTPDSILVYNACPPQVLFPNTITPDCDCPNGYFGPAFKNVRKFQMWVYNRWGEIIFYTEDPDEHWDGTYQGVKVEVGVYPWRATWEPEHEKFGTKYEQTGKVTVVR